MEFSLAAGRVLRKVATKVVWMGDLTEKMKVATSVIPKVLVLVY